MVVDEIVQGANVKGKEKMMVYMLKWRTGEKVYLKSQRGTSLQAQWLRIRLPVQGTWV